MSRDEAAADGAPAEVEMQTVGVDEMVRQERVRSVFESKRSCRDARTKASNEAAIGDVNAGLIAYRNALETYVREVEPLFAQTEAGRRFWSDYDFGEVDLRPRYENIEEIYRGSGVVEDADPVDRDTAFLQLRGLRSLFETDTPIKVPFKIFTKHKKKSRSGLSMVETVSHNNIPLRTLDRMYAVTNGYLAEIGFGVEVGKAEQHTKLDDDLLDEVEAWRRENL